MHTKDSERFAGDGNFFQFRTVPKTLMGRKQIWTENETALKSRNRNQNWAETAVGRNYNIYRFGPENEKKIRSVFSFRPTTS